jgi:hypothetical protein
VGVPLKVPVLGVKVRPAGRTPLSLYATLPVPPVVVNCWLQAWPQVSAVIEVGLRERAGLMVRESFCVAVSPTLSVAVTLTVKLPLAVGVPLKVPVLGVKARPLGRVPLSLYVTLPVPPLAVNFWLYATPTVLDGSEVGPRDRAGLMVRESLCVAVAPTLSVAVTLTVNEPLAVGVPLKVPVLVAKLRPAGRAPLSLYVTPPVPPLVVNFWLYATPVVLAGSELGPRERAGLMVRESLSVAVAPTLSMAVTLTVNEPLAVGVPLKVPVLVAKVRPEGRALLSLYVTPPVPPLAVNFWLYATPAVLAGSEPGPRERAGLTVRESLCVALAPTLSVAVTLTANEPLAVGVPLKVPVLVAKVRPVGRVPLSLYVMLPVPPVVVNFWLYATLTVSAGREPGLRERAGLMVRAYLSVVLPDLLVAVTLKSKVPLALGVPLKVPLLALKVRPAGRVPLSLSVMVPVPPLAVNFSLYATPTVLASTELGLRDGAALSSSRFSRRSKVNRVERSCFRDCLLVSERRLMESSP